MRFAWSLPLLEIFFLNPAAAGELSGSLPELLRRQATFLVAMDDLRKKVVSALIYPAMIFVLGIGLIFLFMGYLVPQLTALFQKTGRDSAAADQGFGADE